MALFYQSAFYKREPSRTKSYHLLAAVPLSLKSNMKTKSKYFMKTESFITTHIFYFSELVNHHELQGYKE